MNATNLFNAVMQLDLEPIKTKLMHVESGEGWSVDKANAVEKEYRRFLCLMKMYPRESIAPLVDVDTFWHYHILDTMKYAVDCEQAFGYFVHHYPYVGLGDGDDAQFRIDSGNRMQSLYEATFGEAYPGARSAEPIRIASAYCAGPWNKEGVRAAGQTETAYCAGPWDKQQVRAETAYCAGPWDKQQVRAETAYCAGPWDKAHEHGTAKAATAYCAGPWQPAATPTVLSA